MRQTEFGDYMKKFDHQYKATCDQCGGYFLVGRFGKRGSKLRHEEYLAKIGPYDAANQILGIWVTGISARMITACLKKLGSVLVHEDRCDDGFIGHFHENDLDQVCKIVGVKRRKSTYGRKHREHRQDSRRNVPTEHFQRPETADLFHREDSPRPSDTGRNTGA